MKVGQKFPDFKMDACVSLDQDLGKAFKKFTLEKITEKGKWSVIFFYPKDFTFVCPTELKGFSDLTEAFDDENAKLYSVSVDNAFVHKAWRESHDDLKDLKYPMLSDLNRELSKSLDILDEEGVSQRATYILDPEGIVRFIYITDGSVGRNPKEVLRILSALQTDELCACNWQKGDKGIEV